MSPNKHELISSRRLMTQPSITINHNNYPQIHVLNLILFSKQGPLLKTMDVDVGMKISYNNFKIAKTFNRLIFECYKFHCSHADNEYCNYCISHIVIL